MKRCYWLLALLVSILITASAQTKKPAARQETQKEDVVRISVTLVQVDATVMDKDGREVTDLQPEEFEVSAAGRRQQITNFSYTPAAPATPTEAAQPETVARQAPTAPLRSDQVRRTMALVIDDLGLSSISMLDVKNALKKFVAEQMQPGDLVAILRTGEGMGFLQQFTSDKGLLSAAIERLQWNPVGRAGVGVTPSMGSKEFEERMRGKVSFEDADPAQQRKIFYTLGTVGALKYIVRGLGALPGRKSVILFSDGLQLFTTKEEDELSSTDRRWNVLDARVRDAARELTQAANRASVVIHTVEARGPQTMGGKVEDIAGTSLNSQEFDMDQEGLGFLADETGGVFAQNNDLSRAMARILEEHKGYYLIGFKPDEGWLKANSKSKPKIEVKIKRPSLQVRYRKGFYGNFDEQAKPAPSTPVEKLFAALMSPFSAGGVSLRLTSLFGHDKQDGSFVRSLLYVDASGLTFKEGTDGQYKADANVLAVTFGEDGQMLDDVTKTFTIQARKEEVEQIRRGGFVYEMTMPVKKAGVYQLRVAVQDAASERVGSASQFIEVPDISKNDLALSGIVISGKEQTASVRPAGGVEGGQSAGIDVQATPAVRRFKRGMQLSYALIIFNAQLDQGSNRPQLETQVVLYRDGKPVYTGQVKPLKPGQDSDLKQILATGALTLGAELGPGEYSLQLTVTDKLAKEKHRTATQWINFEITG